MLTFSKKKKNLEASPSSVCSNSPHASPAPVPGARACARQTTLSLSLESEVTLA